MKGYNKNFPFSLLIFIYILSSFSTAILSYYTIKSFDNLYFYGYLTPFVIIGSLSVYKLFHQLDLEKNILSKISHLTLGIYLIHAGILHVINLGLQELKLQFFENAFIGIPILFALTLSMSIIIAVLISRTKYLNKII